MVPPHVIEACTTPVLRLPDSFKILSFKTPGQSCRPPRSTCSVRPPSAQCLIQHLAQNVHSPRSTLPMPGRRPSIPGHHSSSSLQPQAARRLHVYAISFIPPRAVTTRITLPRPPPALATGQCSCLGQGRAFRPIRITLKQGIRTPSKQVLFRHITLTLSFCLGECHIPVRGALRENPPQCTQDPSDAHLAYCHPETQAATDIQLCHWRPATDNKFSAHLRASCAAR